MMNKKKTKRAGKIIRTGLSTVLVAALLVVLYAVNFLLPTYARMINSIAGYKKSVNNSSVTTTGLDLNYYTPDYAKEDMAAAETELDKRISGEGTVLMKNDDGTMPFAAGTRFSFFSANSAGGGGLLASIMSSSADLKQTFEASGFGVNETLWDFYSKGAGKDYGLGSGSIGFGRDEDFSINECPLSVLEGESNLLDSVKNTVPVYVLRRVAGEGRDMPRSMYNHTDIAEDQVKSYLEPTSIELEILQYLNDNFDDVVLLVNSNAALELGWVAEFENINAVVYTSGINCAIGDIFSGAVNPSGRTVDTFAVDNLTSPAAQNFGDYAYVDESGEFTKYHYVSYKEGIYVGYKYYETRYEDVVLGQGNAGAYDYTAEVCFPFGYGLSYTAFDWSGYSAKWNGDECTVSITVKNSGNVAGKDVVQIYAQSPYTEYDKQNNVEKAAAELVAYGKTKELSPGESETLTMTFTREQLKSYDYTNAKTYILEPGDYYIAAGKNAHDAVNNILAAKGKTVADGMTGQGTADFAVIYNPDLKDVDTVTYAKDSYSDTAITNRFDEANGGLVYLSRNDWQGTWPANDGQPSDLISTWGNEINGTDAAGAPASYTYVKTATADEIAKMDSFESGNPEDATKFTDEIVYGAKNGLQLIDLRGLDFDDPLWEDLLDQLTLSDYQDTITVGGYGTPALDSVGKPFCVDADTASGLIYGGTGKTYPTMMTLAQTYNQELAYEYGRMIGSQAVIGGANGWYAPSMNIHRTPFSGRNGEYYSEDAFLSGTVASLEVSGAAEKGLYAFIKHYAFNDQENHRGDTVGQFGHCTWLNEQAAREIYLLPFEMCMKVGDVELNYVAKNADGSYSNASRTMRASQAVMSAFNRIGYTWTGGSHALINGILREEWAFDGFVITDNANTGVFMDAYQMIAAGADAKLTAEPASARYTFKADDVAAYHYGREAMHRILYTVANSNAMNGAMPGSQFVDGIQMVTTVRLVANVVSIALIALMVWLTVRRFRPAKQKNVTK